jgi:hypothetical protein
MGDRKNLSLNCSNQKKICWTHANKCKPQEELKSINEELQSTNEELQSTRNWRLQKKDEERRLQTVNFKNNDMKLLNSTGNTFLDKELNIRRFTDPKNI